MFQAQILMAGTSVYSPWFERGGDFFRATVELVDVNSTGSGDQLTVRVFTKNKEDTTNGAEVNAGTTIAFTAAGRSTQEWSPSTGTGLKELVRYKFTAAGAVGGEYMGAIPRIVTDLVQCREVRRRLRVLRYASFCASYNNLVAAGVRCLHTLVSSQRGLCQSYRRAC